MNLIYWIVFKVGYNKTYGGEGGKPTNEIRRKLSETKIGENNPNYGKPLSNETKRKLSEANKGKTILYMVKQVKNILKVNLWCK